MLQRNGEDEGELRWMTRKKQVEREKLMESWCRSKDLLKVGEVARGREQFETICLDS